MSAVEHEVCFGLTCLSCGHTTAVMASRSPQFAFEVAQAANAVGMLGIIDFDHGRALIFCNSECADKQRKKDGSFRLRMKQIRASEVQS